MSDDFEDRVRPTRESPMRPASGDNLPPRRRDRDDEDEYRPRRRASGGDSGVKTVLIVLACIGVVGFCLIGSVVLGMVLLVRTASKQIGVAIAAAQTNADYSTISAALHAYETKHGRFPPVAMKTKDGKPGLSWRVAILPFMGEEALYKEFKLDEAWDHPDNMKLASRMPLVFSAKNGDPLDQTHVRVFAGPRAIMNFRESKRTADITDGMANTILLVESTQAIRWIEPTELSYEKTQPFAPLGASDRDYFTVAFADGMVRPLQKSISPDKLRLAVTCDDGQPVDLDN